MVLTVQATEVAPRTSDRKTRRARMEMIKWFLFNGVDGQRTRFGIYFADKRSMMVVPTTADACLTVCYMAVVRT